MAIITEVQFAHERGALAETLNTLPDVDVTVVQDAGTDPEHNVYLMRFEGTALDEIKAVLETDPSVTSIEPMRGFEDQRLLGIEITPETVLLNPKVTSEEGFVIKAQGAAVAEGVRGWHERWLLPDGETLRQIWQYARENGFEFTVLDFRQRGESIPTLLEADLLTDQQREALVTALEGGYFTEPREMSLEELAERLDLSSGAAARRLRRGMKSLIGKTLVVGDSSK
ncbi:MAG: helix-turn-helix domain-containing protein [Halolamina sp.]|uniref:helix-turn-helix domain-containing protein n=1 Tax=Halolamina sp. TaxID=1940283 RepID=UPI002FC37488